MRLYAPTERWFLLCNDKCVKESDLHLYPREHLIGEIVHILLGGRKVKVLGKWQVHVSTTGELPTVVEIDEHIVMAVHIRCKHEGCEKKVSWELSKQSRDALFSRYAMDEHLMLSERLKNGKE